MQAIAAEMNVADTAFLSPGRQPGRRPRLRWFTPTREVAYCGHATVATVHALVEAGPPLRRSSGSRSTPRAATSGWTSSRARRRPRLARARPSAGQPFARSAAGVIAGRPASRRRPATGGRRRADRPIATCCCPCRAWPRSAASHRTWPRWRARRRRPASAGSAWCRGRRWSRDRRPIAGSSRRTTGSRRIPSPARSTPRSACGCSQRGLLRGTGTRVHRGAGRRTRRPGRLRVDVESAPGRPPRVRVGGRAVTVLDGRIALA